MFVIHGNKGIFQNSKFAGLNGSIAEDGTLSIVAIAADGLGTSTITVHEEKLDMDEKYRSILEVHLRENIHYALVEKNTLDAFKIVHSVEYVHAKLINPQTTPQDRILLTLPEGNKLSVKTTHDRYPGSDIRGPRWFILKHWAGVKESLEQSKSYYSNTLRLEKIDGSFEEIEHFEAAKRSRSAYDY